MVIGLLKSVPLAERVVVAHLDAVLKMSSVQKFGSYKISLTLVWAVALSCRTPTMHVIEDRDDEK